MLLIYKIEIIIIIYIKIIKLLIQSLTYTEVMKNKILKLKKIKHY